MSHPRYAGPVIDAHCHYDAGTRSRAAEINAQGGLRSAIHFWDLHWPPRGPMLEAGSWRGLEPELFRCHVPDLSMIGEADCERRLERDLRAAVNGGCAGVKLWKNLGLWLTDIQGSRLAVDDSRLQVIWATAAELDVPIAIHQGDPPAFFWPMTDDNPRIEELRAHPDWWYGGGEFPSLERVHDELEATIASNPQTCFIAVHFGCFMSWDEVARMFRTYPNYHVDTAAAIADMGRDGNADETRRIIIENADRVIFGSDLIRTQGFDMPAQAKARWDLSGFYERHWRFFETADAEIEHPLPAQGPWAVSGLDLPDAVLPRLYHQNAQSIFKLPSSSSA